MAGDFLKTTDHFKGLLWLGSTRSDAPLSIQNVNSLLQRCVFSEASCHSSPLFIGIVFIIESILTDIGVCLISQLVKLEVCSL